MANAISGTAIDTVKDIGPTHPAAAKGITTIFE